MAMAMAILLHDMAMALGHGLHGGRDPPSSTGPPSPASRLAYHRPLLSPACFPLACQPVHVRKACQPVHVRKATRAQSHPDARVHTLGGIRASIGEHAPAPG